MKDLAPDLKRQRLLIEGFFNNDVDRERVDSYFKFLCKEMDFKPYGDPIIFSPEGLGKEDNQGFDAFLPLIDSGVSVYIWSSRKFFSIIIYTCKNFDNEKATKVTKKFWQADETAQMNF